MQRQPVFLIASLLGLLSACPSSPSPSTTTVPRDTQATRTDAATPAPPRPTPSADAAIAAPNPVQAEMRALHQASRDWVSAIANNTLDGIPSSIGTIHQARMVTEQAVTAGQYHPPKNGSLLSEFAKQDEAFHDELVKLLRAARAKDLPATTKQLGVVLEGCTACHQRFRF